MQNHIALQHVFQGIERSLACVESSGAICFDYNCLGNLIPPLVAGERPRSRYRYWLCVQEMLHFPPRLWFLHWIKAVDWLQNRLMTFLNGSVWRLGLANLKLLYCLVLNSHKFFPGKTHWMVEAILFNLGWPCDFHWRTSKQKLEKCMFIVLCPFCMEPFCYHVNKLKLASWKVRNHLQTDFQTAQQSQLPHPRPQTCEQDHPWSFSPRRTDLDQMKHPSTSQSQEMTNIVLCCFGMVCYIANAKWYILTLPKRKII